MIERFFVFVRRAGVVCLSLMALHFLALWFIPQHYYLTFGLALIIFMFFFFSVFHYVLLRLGSQRSAALFVRFFMGLTAFKMLLLLFILTVYVLFNRQNALPFIVVFFVTYVSFSALEVVHSYQFLRKVSS